MTAVISELVASCPMLVHADIEANIQATPLENVDPVDELMVRFSGTLIG